MSKKSGENTVKKVMLQYIVQLINIETEQSPKTILRQKGRQCTCGSPDQESLTKQVQVQAMVIDFFAIKGIIMETGNVTVE